ncbi:MAG: cadherin domain-containing protein, partial [Leptolyngbyaceae cyanobacterium]
MLTVDDPMTVSFELLGLKSDLDIEIYSPKKKLKKVLRKIGGTSFRNLTRKERKLLRRHGISKRRGKQSEDIEKFLEPGTYFIRIFGKQRKNQSKYTLQLDPISEAIQLPKDPEPDLPNIPIISSNGGEDTASVAVLENTTFVTDVNVTDFDGDTENGGGLVYTITGGSDRELFEIDPSGGLYFKAAPDFEAPADQEGDNRYEVEVTVTDSTGLTDRQAIAINVTNDNDENGQLTPTPSPRPDQTPSLQPTPTPSPQPAPTPSPQPTPTPSPQPPRITSDGGGDTASVAVQENLSFVTDVSAETESSGGLTYTLGGVDGRFFTIDPTSGKLAFKEPPDFETPQDQGSDNRYEVAVTATDSQGLTDTQTITVNVTNIDYGGFTGGGGSFDWDDPFLWGDATQVNFESFAPAWTYGKTEPIGNLRNLLTTRIRDLDSTLLDFDTVLVTEQPYKYLPFYINGSYEDLGGAGSLDNHPGNDNHAIFQLTVEAFNSPVAFSQETYVIQRSWFDAGIGQVSELSDLGDWFLVDESTYPDATPKLEYGGQFLTTTVIIIDSLADTERLMGAAGDDNIFGGDGDDTIEGGATNDPTDPTIDHLHGGSGNDTIIAGQDISLLYGGTGNDTLRG